MSGKCVLYVIKDKYVVRTKSFRTGAELRIRLTVFTDL